MPRSQKKIKTYWQSPYWCGFRGRQAPGHVGAATVCSRGLCLISSIMHPCCLPLPYLRNHASVMPAMQAWSRPCKHEAGHVSEKSPMLT